MRKIRSRRSAPWIYICGATLCILCSVYAARLPWHKAKPHSPMIDEAAVNQGVFYTVDYIEEGTVTLLPRSPKGQQITVREQLESVREGDIVYLTGDPDHLYTIDHEKTAQIRADIADLLMKLQREQP